MSSPSIYVLCLLQGLFSYSLFFFPIIKVRKKSLFSIADTNGFERFILTSVTRSSYLIQTYSQFHPTRIFIVRSKELHEKKFTACQGFFFLHREYSQTLIEIQIQRMCEWFIAQLWQLTSDHKIVSFVSSTWNLTNLLLSNSI